jgi:hypothetical protein
LGIEPFAFPAQIRERRRRLVKIKAAPPQIQWRSFNFFVTA